MEYRKLQITGKSTFVISIPKEWIKRNNLRKGDILQIEEVG
ncbi:MAG TPA: AbrB/MazE/SpoVT family DNA-binding domain-containing protein, partial [Candidatus Altiarchaeales archaeon]|nr:AbrB/MazE/SpoVT family DNA-binding domain-containing protein [Candidatus Altiarchaeales archaeon]HEX54596.1 AbrB/MazE/SpoVT family DNA-binding domain-containing protein [Candidatus Altiarchaeales archaeon]